MAKIINIQGTGTFSKDVIKAVKRTAEKTVKILTKKARRKIRKRKRPGNPSGRSEHCIAVPKNISRKMRKQKGF